jgi:V/A-type H+-transporting ATPase subunit I
MGLAKLKKATFLVYEDEREEFLKELQDLSIFHVSDCCSSSIAEEYPDLIPEKELKDSEALEVFQKLERIIEVLKPYSDEKGLLGQFIDLKIGISKEKYESIINELDREEIKKICACEERRYHLVNQLTELKEKKEFYQEWIKIEIPIAEFSTIENATVKVYKIKAKKEEMEEILKDTPVDYSIIFEGTVYSGVFFIIYKGFEKEFEESLGGFDTEMIDFRNEERSPKEIISKCKREIRKVEKELEKILKFVKQKSNEFEKFLVYYDYFYARLKRTNALNKALRSREVYFIEGWIDEEDKTKLEELISSYKGVDLEWTEVRHDESPPVKLKNNKLAEPYEVLTSLYAYPRSKEIDPSPFIGLFFGLFFAFCLTDAVYGLILTIVGFLLMRRIPEGKKYLWIFIVGGIFTIFAGAITGGWLGDIDRLFPALSNFRQRFILLDPFQNPLNFLYLSLGFGIVQIAVGLSISIKEKIKKKYYLDAFANEVSWILLFIFLGIFIYRYQKVGITNDTIFLGGLFLLPLFTIILFSWRSNKWYKQIPKGLFTLFRGLVGFMGNILSYSRIMALGLVTAGLAMSVNILTLLVKDMFPVVGPVLAVIVFIGGHTFSLAINTLSGFVHTMRLQFAEFFSYFYEGGGSKFEPLGYAGKYTRIEK